MRRFPAFAQSQRDVSAPKKFAGDRLALGKTPVLRFGCTLVGTLRIAIECCFMVQIT